MTIVRPIPLRPLGRAGCSRYGVRFQSWPEGRQDNGLGHAGISGVAQFQPDWRGISAGELWNPSSRGTVPALKQMNRGS